MDVPENDQLSVPDRLIGVSWSANVGDPLPSNDTNMVLRVHSWDEAIRECSGEGWANLQLEATNTLTRELSENHRSEYRKWNRFVDATKEHMALDILQIDNRVSELGIDPIVAASAKWDVLHAAMEERYAKLSQFRFFTQLIDLYVSGHFPCGWRGDWPTGQLVVY